MEAESTVTEEGGYCIPTKGSIQQKISHNEPQPELTTNVRNIYQFYVNNQTKKLNLILQLYQHEI